MYFSRITLDPNAPRSGHFWHAAADAYQLHREMWRLLGAGPDAGRDFLYRAETHEGCPTFYARAPRPAYDDKGVWRIETRPWAPRLRVDQPLHFKLRANAVAKIGGVRHDIIMHARTRLEDDGVPRADWPTRAELEQTEGRRWLEARADDKGLRVDELRVDGHRIERFRRRGKTIRMGTLDFTGRLTVCDVERFEAALTHGIGPSKSFGCGMLLIRPA